MKVGIVLLSLLSVVSLSAQATDVAVRIDADPRSAYLSAGYGVHVAWSGDPGPEALTLVVDTTAPISEVFEWDAEMSCTREATRLRCTLPAVTSFTGGVYVRTKPPAPGKYSARATVTVPASDPDASNNTAEAVIDVIGLPLLRPYVVSDGALKEHAVDPARPSTLRVGVQNDGEPATDLVVRLTLPDGGTFTEVEPAWRSSCEVTPQEVVCRFATTFHSQFLVGYVTPDRDDGSTFRAEISVTAAQPDASPEGRASTTVIPLRRRFNVTHGGDSGPGSLRQAMSDAAASCAESRCLIAFHTADPIRPLTPLPALAGFVKIDGGDVHRELDGSLLREGGAIVANTCELRVARLYIHDFPGHAIETETSNAPGCSTASVFTPSVLVQRNVLSRNERGVVTRSDAVTIEENVIRENRRAGVFVNGGWRVEVLGNDLSSNGASGIYVSLWEQAPYSGLSPVATVRENWIHDNREWGVGRSRNGWVEISSNSIAGNGLLAIDVGLDLESPNRTDDRLGVPNAPVLHSAWYDPSRNKTIVRGEFPHPMEIFASRSLTGEGRAQAEWSVGRRYSVVPGVKDVELDGDLRGVWISAISIKSLQPDWVWLQVDTSELSNAVKVE